MHPIRRIMRSGRAIALRQQPLCQRVPAAVERRRNQRIGIVAHAGPSDVAAFAVAGVIAA